jgi:hypothetical protein
MDRACHTSRRRSPARSNRLAFVLSYLLGSACAGAPAPPTAETQSSREAGGRQVPGKLEAVEPASPQSELQLQVEDELKRKVAAAQGGDHVVVNVRLRPLVEPCRRVLIVVAHIHGSGIQLLDLTVDSAKVARFTSVIARSVPPPQLTAAPPRFELFSNEVDSNEAERVLRRAALAISAEIQVEATQAGDDLVLRSLKVVHDTEVIAVRAWLSDGSPLDRTFEGQPGNLTEQRRAPLDLVRADLVQLASAAQPATDEPRVRAMLVEAWSAVSAMPPWSRSRLVALAAALPSLALVPLLRPGLDEQGELRVRAINALAAATDVDLRRDAAGRVRAIDDVAQAYRELLDTR